ncbi:hypothetical protein Xcel_1410 [Xylanimonas cellulosilytica DSM 15894]|uniref:Winged helix DNA-binding domain-containing protein n=1 Tax=Xylanimonas cellulosilytica (strain DSM 15894 / JCM 12276 / CECT 5975 / KCTC 9989 / LMG 20990 / NBRC 107835 / XIL07) TaxID=446471 RepID=D1BRI6_XYLCX|nr:crosslink repair DNA glycosylase YcaQ family protein [Xylanimonas cellulosilytica]ACZ30441.1 hypothetical protein Xcel_1410 [Xylanimonas cellulosilytica DSM 15894]
MKSSLITHRLRPQRMTGTPLPTGAVVVGHLGAVQSQLHDMSLWSLSGRSGLTRAELAAEFAAGAFLRTHVLRPTWHHVLTADLPDLLELTAERVRRSLDTGGRTWGLPAAERHAAADIAVDAVRADGPLTRAEVGARLLAAGCTGPDGTWGSIPLGSVLAEAELRGAVGSGPMRGKQHTYRALDLPPSSRTPDERLAWLASTYVRGHGPSRPEDLAWWATLPITVARRAFALAPLRPVTLAGVDLFTADDAEPVADEVPAALLLPNYDELISYRRDPGDWGPQGTDAVLRAQGLVLFDGALAGSWTRTESASAVRVEVTTPVRVTRRAAAALEAEAARFGRFAGLPAKLVLP